MQKQTIKISTIKSNPNNPRVIKDEKFEKLLKSIMEFPKMMELRPIIVDENNIVLGGNMRLKALKQLGYKEIPDNWVKKSSDLTEEEKKAFIVKDNVGFGDWDWANLNTEWDSKKLEEWGLEIPVFGPEKESKPDYSTYTTKIKSPVYTPSDKKPKVEELFDKTVFNKLIEDINKSNISDSDKMFLTNAAQRHIVFNYEKIADYYAHSDKETQNLMENSGLVIIDFNKAIELGYVKLSEEISEQFKEDHDEE